MLELRFLKAFAALEANDLRFEEILLLFILLLSLEALCKSMTVTLEAFY